MKKNNILYLLIVTFSTQAVFGMERIDVAQQPQTQIQKPQGAQTLYNYCGISNKFAAQGNIDIKKQWVREILKDQEWWYVVERDSFKDCPAQLVSYSSDGSLLVAACKDNTVHLFDERGKNTLTKKYDAEITGLACSPKEPFFVVSLANCTMEKVDYKGEVLKIIRDESRPQVIAIHPEGTHLCTKPHKVEPGVIPELKIWPLKGGIPLRLEVPKGGINDFAFYSGQDSNVIVGEGIVLRKPHPIEPNRGTITTIGNGAIRTTSVVTCSDGKRSASGAHDGSIAVWDDEWAVRRVLTCFATDINNKPVTQPVSKVSFTRKSGCLAAASGSNLFLFDIRPELKCWRQIARLPHDDQGVSSVACHPKKNKLVTACGHNNMQVWQRFENPKFEHILLRLVLKEHLTRCLLEHIEPKCPNEKEQSSDEQFIAWMAHAFNVTTGSLKDIWRTFPEDMRKSIIRTYVYRAKAILALPRVAERVAAKKREEERALEQKKRARYWSSILNY